jgi:hypothetical protein
MTHPLIDQMNDLRLLKKQYVDALNRLVDSAYEADACDPIALQKNMECAEQLAHSCKVLINELRQKHGCCSHD